ncbi:HPr family phosphocarrier protein [Proteiniborus sp. MB09-C3]|uniref:HPr family phosphocarrier protein n=1 Tax=Proteiniborus sp. MB09-C3 TaxID=3050072 RepID=UPI0025557381|nr:HPr family phosphocarrier protein [Proteiniborus sp. MB09-C3]WIV13529.1 HPr family phosphocarrier protein [Proteiniborus sp. MB09-C3]
MITKIAVIKNSIGLHARPAALFVRTCSKYRSEIFVEKDGKKVNAKSIMGIMALGVSPDEKIKIMIDGIDEEAAMKDILDLIENGLEQL